MGGVTEFSAPEPLTASHDLAHFDCGDVPLNNWLKGRALANQLSGASRCFVLCSGSRVVAYYALAAGSVSARAAPGSFRRNMPEPIPIVLLARLAVDRSQQGRGLGRVLFRDAALRILNAADSIGVRGVLTHAASQEAKAFYIALGFDPSPLEEMTLMVKLDDLRSISPS